MTALIYSLALGFLMFLSISCRMQIEVSTAETLKNQASYFNVKTLDKQTFDVAKTELILKQHADLIDEFSWVTAKLHEFDGTTVSTTYLNDMVDYPQQTVEVQGLQPNYFRTAVTDYTVEHHSHLDKGKGMLYNWIGHPEASALDFGDLLYTPRGSQGLGTTGFMDEQIKVKRLWD